MLFVLKILNLVIDLNSLTCIQNWKHHLEVLQGSFIIDVWSKLVVQIQAKKIDSDTRQIL
jgi:hypothetical protein